MIEQFKNLKMKLKTCCYVSAAMCLIMLFPCGVHAEEKVLNSLYQITAEKPVDNIYQLNLYFEDKFDGNAFVQKIKNGSFHVFVPNTEAAAKNIKVIFKGRAKPSDVKISVNELPYTKDDNNSKCVKLLVQTPVNSDIQLTAQKFTTNNTDNTKIGGFFMSISSIIAAILLAVSAILLVSICKAMKSMSGMPRNYTSFPASFVKSPQEYAAKADSDTLASDYEGRVLPMPPASKMKSGSEMLSPIEKSGDFNCFNLENTEDAQDMSSQIRRDKTASNPISQTEADASANNPAEEENGEYGPELVSELKIGADKGFYLTKIPGNSYALFGYASNNIFFLQKFGSLSQFDLQVKFYDRKAGRDVYIVSLDKYKAAVTVSDTEIKELALI